MPKQHKTLSKAQLDQRSRVLNPNNPEFKARMDHHSDQLNDNAGTSGVNPARKAVIENIIKQTEE